MIIYNVLGQQVKIIENNFMKAGHHIFDWNGLDVSGNEVASGIYFYELRTENFVAKKKMLLIR
jgi:flagellar hook assembly protein FlgD